MSEALKARITEEMKVSMKAGDKPRLGAIRLILAGVKQREVDERISLNDEQVLSILDKMSKQRRESIGLFQAAKRMDLVEQEELELAVIQSFLPQSLSEEEIIGLIQSAVAESGASSMRDMSKVMALLRPKLQGRADMTSVSAKIKDQLTA